MNVHDRRVQMRAILAGDQFVRPASVYDAISARAAEAIGYEMMMMAGSTASKAVLSGPDLVLLTLSEFVEQARRVTRAVSLPLMVDGDHGYGNALNVMRCVEELEAAGVSALTIEDTLLPLPFGAPDESLVPIDEAVGKMKAAVAARTDPSLVILARTSAVRLEGIDSAVKRLKAYEATGIDGMFFSGMRKRAELDALHAASSMPFVLGSMTPEMDDSAYLASQGARVGGWSHQPLQAATLAMYNSLRELRGAGTSNEIPPALTGGDLMNVLGRQSGYDEDTARYLQ